jgi:hypothetical protein
MHAARGCRLCLLRGVSYPHDVLVYTIRDSTTSPDHPLDDAVETFIRREDAERFVEQVRGDEPELASHLRIEKRGRPKRPSSQERYAPHP